MTKSETIEVEGIRFNADEVLSVTIERGGRKIHIDEVDESRGMGFHNLKLETEGER